MKKLYLFACLFACQDPQNLTGNITFQEQNQTIEEPPCGEPHPEPPTLFLQDQGANHSIIFLGEEQYPGSVEPYFGYGAFPAVGDNGNDELFVVYRRASKHGVDYNTSSLRLNRSINAGRSWLYDRTNERMFEWNQGSDPYSPSLMRRQCDGRHLLTYERDLPTNPYRLVFYRTTNDGGQTWSEPVQMPNVGTLYTSAGGHCIELSWGTGLCPGDGCSILCPMYYRNNAENRYTSVAMFSSNGLNGTFSYRSDIMRDPNPGGLQFEEPHVELLTGNGSCGTVATSTSCLLALVREDTTCTIRKTFSADSGRTWQAGSVAFPGIGWPDLEQDDETGIILAMTRSCPRTEGRSVFYTSVDRGQTWTGPLEFGDREWPSAINGGGTSYLYGQIIDRGSGHWGVSYAQEGITSGVRLAYLDVYANQVPPNIYKSRRVWVAPPGPPSAYATFNEPIPALHGISRLTCGVWGRRNTVYQAEDIIRYGGSSNNTQQNFYIQQHHSNSHWEVSIASSLGSFSRGITANNTSIVDTNEAFLFTYDGNGGALNSQKLQMGRNGVDLTPTTTYTAPIPTLTTAPLSAVLRLGAGYGGQNYIRGSVQEQIACWIGNNAPTAQQFSIALERWYNNGDPPDPQQVANGWGGSFPELFWDFDGDLNNRGSLNIGTPVLSDATFEFSSRRVIGAGYLSP